MACSGFPGAGRGGLRCFIVTQRLTWRWRLAGADVVFRKNETGLPPSPSSITGASPRQNIVHVVHGRRDRPLSLSLSLSHCASVCLSVSVFTSLSLSVHVSFSVCLTVSACVCLSVSLAACLFLSLCLSLSVRLSVSRSHPLCGCLLSVPVGFWQSLSLPLSPPLSISGSLWLPYYCLCLSRSVSHLSLCSCPLLFSIEMHAQTISTEDLPPSHLSLSKFPSKVESGDFHPGNFLYPSLNNFTNSANGQTELFPAPGFPRQPLLPVEMTSGEKILPSPSVLQ